MSEIPQEYDDGDAIFATNAITDENGDAYDPPSLAFLYRWAGDETSTTLTYGVDAALTRDSAGNYTVRLDSTGHPGLVSGQWIAAPGTGQLSERWEAYVRARIA